MDKEDMDTFNRLFSPEKRSKMMQKRLNRQIAKIMRWEKLIDLYVKKTRAYYQDF